MNPVNPLLRNGAAPRVRVGSSNGPKVAAVEAAFSAFASGVEVVGAAVESGVSEQPVGFEEIALGARNRAREAWRSGACDFSVGIEDGLVEIPTLGRDALNVGCAVVTDGERESCGLSSAFPYPAACAAPALEWREPIGEQFDTLWRQRRGDAACEGDEVPSSMTVGNIGKLTLGVVPRAEYARHAVICALVRFLHPDLFFE